MNGPGEFSATDTEVQQLAVVFQQNGWTWRQDTQPPNTEAIAVALNELHEASRMFKVTHLEECETCKAGDSYYCGDRPNHGNASSGRLWVSWDDEDGYGEALHFGLEYDRGPELFR